MCAYPETDRVLFIGSGTTYRKGRWFVVDGFEWVGDGDLVSIIQISIRADSDGRFLGGFWVDGYHSADDDKRYRKINKIVLSTGYNAIDGILHYG